MESAFDGTVWQKLFVDGVLPPLHGEDGWAWRSFGSKALTLYMDTRGMDRSGVFVLYGNYDALPGVPHILAQVPARYARVMQILLCTLRVLDRFLEVHGEPARADMPEWDPHDSARLFNDSVRDAYLCVVNDRSTVQTARETLQRRVAALYCLIYHAISMLSHEINNAWLGTDVPYQPVLCNMARRVAIVCRPGPTIDVEAPVEDLKRARDTRSLGFETACTMLLCHHQVDVALFLIQLELLALPNHNHPSRETKAAQFPCTATGFKSYVFRQFEHLTGKSLDFPAAPRGKSKSWADRPLSRFDIEAGARAIEAV